MYDLRDSAAAAGGVPRYPLDGDGVLSGGVGWVVTISGTVDDTELPCCLTFGLRFCAGGVDECLGAAYDLCSSGSGEGDMRSRGPKMLSISFRARLSGSGGEKSDAVGMYGACDARLGYMVGGVCGLPPLCTGGGICE
jgi:hypothetical protein